MLHELWQQIRGECTFALLGTHEGQDLHVFFPFHHYDFFYLPNLL